VRAVPPPPLSASSLDRPRLDQLAPRSELAELAAAASALAGVAVQLEPVAEHEADPGEHPVPWPASARVMTALVEIAGHPVARVRVGPYRAKGAANEGETASLRELDEDTARRVTEAARVFVELSLSASYRAAATSTMHSAAMRRSHQEASSKDAALAETLARLSELERLKSNFLATISHELRTPLTSIIGYTEMLAEGIGGPLTEEQREFVETVRGKSVQLLELILRLLDLSKLESGAVALAFADVALGPIVDEVVGACGALAAKKNVRISVEPIAPELSAVGDRERLRQVVRHLLENGVKFCEPGGEVRVSARATSHLPPDGLGAALLLPVTDVAELRVADDGAGVPRNERQRIFDPFFQVDQSSTRRHGGVGVGLAIVKRLVEAQGGTVRVEANEPRGSLFIVTLPIGRRPGSASMPPSR
jgi:two-component system sensor histidine kinase BarA